jgi:hypothetical protein
MTSIAVNHPVSLRWFLPGELLRIFEGAFEDKPGDRVDVDCGDFSSKPHGFQRDRAAADKGIEHAAPNASPCRERSRGSFLAARVRDLIVKDA